ncbi:MAG: FAD-binding oxidoreductase, partial [Emcibacteraceae bacterium]|nr:FAD-binding oxidoreductase [Emcibacteraceae bacterium]
MADPKNTSYWLETAPVFTGAVGPEFLGEKFDVAVIGGGFTGLSTALELANRGAKVAVLEAGRVVGGASGRNGGQCNNGLAHDFASLASNIGREKALYFYRSYVEAVNTVERLIQEHDIDCDFRRCGRLKLAAKPEHFEKLVKSFDILRDGVDENVELISPQK